MKYIDIEEWYAEVLQNISDPYKADKYRMGIINDFRTYVLRELRDKVRIEEKTIYIPNTLMTLQFVDGYFEKRDFDFSAKDCANMALNHSGIPPKKLMSLESLEKTIREVFDEYKDKVYIKYSKRNANTLCVDWNTACLISSHPDVTNLIQKQIKKTENKTENKTDEHSNDVEWRAYKFEKDKIAHIESLSSHDNVCDVYSSAKISEDGEISLVAEAVFRNLFTEFDFDKYEYDLNEMELLYDNGEFGERYQKLYDIFHSPNYNWEYYKLNTDSPLIDALSDKIAEKIIKKLFNKKD